MPPLFAAIGALFSFIGAGFTALAGALGISVGQLGLAALAIGAQLFLAKKPTVPKAEDGKVSLRQPTPPLRRIYGEGDFGGDYFFFRNRAGIAYQGLVFSLGPISEVLGWRLHDEDITLDANGYVTAPDHFRSGNPGPFGGGSASPNGARVRVLSRLGHLDDTAYQALTLGFSEVCDEDFRTPGLATGLILAQSVDQKEVAKVYKQGLPAPRKHCLGVPVWDPRDLAQDPDDDFNDPVTWEFRRSPTLCALDYLRHWSGFGRPLSKLYVPEFEASADIDDRLELGWNGAYEPRYELGGRYDLGDVERKVVLAAILQAADLWVYQRLDGTIGIKGGDWYEPTVRITDDDIIAVRQATFDKLTEGAEILRGEYTSAAHKFSTVDAVAWPDGSDPRATAGESQKKSMPWVLRHRQARLLMQIEYDRLNARRGTAVITGRRLDVFGERFVIIHSPRRGLYECPVELSAPPAWTPNDQLAFEWRVVNPERYVLSPSAEGPPPVVVVFDPDSGVPSVANFRVSIQSETVSGGQVAAYALIEWDPPTTDDLSHEIDYVEWNGSATVGSVRTIRVAAGIDSARTDYLPQGKTYQFTMLARAPSDKPGPRTSPILRTVIVGIDPPDAPALSLALVSGTAQGTITAPNDATVQSLRLYRVAGGGVFDVGAVPVKIFYSAPNQTHAVNNAAPTGTWDYYAISANQYGDYSETPTGPVTVVIP